MRYLALTLALSLAALAGCAGLTPSGSSAASAGAPQPSTNLAQTARDQASIPGQAYGGHSYWNFASAGAAEIQARVLALAEKNNWTPEQVNAALSSTNGAPDSVTITVGGNVTGGNAENAGAGTAGAGSAAGGGSVTRP